MNKRRTELRLVLDVTGAAGDQLIVLPIHLGRGGVTEAVASMLKESARRFPATVYSAPGEAERLSSDISPMVSLVLYLCSQAAEITEAGTEKRLRLAPRRRRPRRACGSSRRTTRAGGRWAIALVRHRESLCRNTSQANQLDLMPARVPTCVERTGIHVGPGRKISLERGR
jgi:hypothetical protein